MGALDPISSVTPTPNFKSFSLTHIVYDPSHPLSIPLTLLSLSPIFLFVSYFTLVIFNRQLTILLLAVGQLGNEAVNLILKRLYKAERPFPGYGEVGRGYGMPSSHAQASGFLVAWGVSYVITGKRRCIVSSPEKGILEAIRWWRTRVYVFGLLLWSWLVSYSRWVQPCSEAFKVEGLSATPQMAPIISFANTSHSGLHLRSHHWRYVLYRDRIHPPLSPCFIIRADTKIRRGALGRDRRGWRMVNSRCGWRLGRGPIFARRNSSKESLMTDEYPLCLSAMFSST